jgi:hypothetical protein
VSGIPVDCMALIHLGVQEIAWLNEMDGAAHEVQEGAYCELQRGHAGPHAALGQTAGESNWWVHWTLQAWEIVLRQPCDGTGDVPDELGEYDMCLLYDRHEGAHTFEFA